MIRTMLHGHAFDGSRAERELGISYTPIETTFERMVAWYRETGPTSERVELLTALWRAEVQ